jgi:steroid 5-alpha reductase family enzyme
VGILETKGRLLDIRPAAGAISRQGVHKGMTKPDRNAVVAFPLVVMIGAGVGAAGSQGGTAVGKIPVFAFCIALAFLIQWLAFLPAFFLQSERFYDITGSITFITVATVAVLLGPEADARSYLLLAMVVVWAARLGVYLFGRIRKTGTDARFDAIKPSFIRFLTAWFLQGLWVTLTLSAALAAITTSVRKDLGPVAMVGLLVWAAGFAFEVVADVQKSRFRADPANKGTFIRDGLWAWSRHPNYFGEIVLWIGVALVAVPVLHGWQWVTLISPVFVFLLITRVSGVPLLEKKADERWGGRGDYEDYKAHTPVLVPLPRTAVAGKGVRR